MTRRDWWLGMLLLVAAILVHAAVPRYDAHMDGTMLVRVNRWTGAIHLWGPATKGQWVAVPR